MRTVTNPFAKGPNVEVFLDLDKEKFYDEHGVHMTEAYFQKLADAAEVAHWAQVEAGEARIAPAPRTRTPRACRVAVPA
jgi:hypothetical protein